MHFQRSANPGADNPIVIGVGADEGPDERAAIRRAIGVAYAVLHEEPKLLLLFSTCSYTLPTLLGAARVLGGPVPLIGGTSCPGLLTGAGLSRAGHRPQGLALMAIGGAGLSAGVGHAELGGEPRAAGEAAAETALAAAGAGVPPRAAIMVSPPGYEESILSGVVSVIGNNVPLLGFSAADPGLLGQWAVFADDYILVNGVAVALLSGDFSAGGAFSGGYWPTAHVAQAGRVSGRMLGYLDGQPAADVYARWLGVPVDALRGQAVRRHAVLSPLALEDQRTHRLIIKEPATVLSTGEIGLLADVREGDILRLLTATPESLVVAAGAAVSEATMRAGLDAGHVKGVLLAQGAGRVLALHEHASEAALQIRHLVGAAPLLGSATLGEQSLLPDGRPVHLNLTTSVLVFGY